MSILFFGSRSDPHLRLVARELEALGVEPEFVDHLSEHPVSLHLPTGVLKIGQRAIALEGVRLAWSRAKIKFRPFGVDEAFVHEHLWGKGWRTFIDELAELLGDKTVNSARAVRDSSNKLRQLVVASDLGFQTPSTLVSSDPDEIASWARDHQNIITKSLGGSSLPAPSTQHGYSAIMTTRVDWELFQANREGVRSLPTLYQQEIPKAFELRVAVQGRSAFAFKIDSQAREYTKVDWRYGSALRIFEPYALPAVVQDRVFAYLDAFGLFAGHFDFVVTPNGEYIFLECNPQGQWAFLDDVTSGEMSRTFARELMDRAGLAAGARTTTVRLLAFSLPDCEPCDRVFSALRPLAAERGLQLDIVKVDSVGETAAHAALYDVKFYPSVFALQGGRVIARLQGATSKSGPVTERSLCDWLDRLHVLAAEERSRCEGVNAPVDA